MKLQSFKLVNYIRGDAMLFALVIPYLRSFMTRFLGLVSTPIYALSKIYLISILVVSLTACDAHDASKQLNNHNNELQSKQKNLSTDNQQTKSKISIPMLQAKMNSSSLISVVVARVVDGDTIHVTMPNGKDENIRMLLIDTPEDVSPSKPVEPYGYTAANYARKHLEVGQHIYIQKGVAGHTRDKYGRLLAYIYITPKDMYNEDIVKKGYARVAYVIPPNIQHLEKLRAAQAYAQSHHLGIWSISNYVTSSGYNLSIACRYAEKNGYSTHGCSTLNTGNDTGKGANSESKGGVGETSPKTAEITNETLTVHVGDEATVTVKTTPYTLGKIEVDYQSGPSHAHGLEAKKATSQGELTWSWKIGSNTTPGTYNVIISIGEETLIKHLIVSK